MRRPNFRPILFSALTAAAMLCLALFWLSLPRTFGDEAFFIKWTSLVKKTVLGFDPKPAAESFLYVDVSRSKSVIPAIDPLFEEYTGYNHTAITDRTALANFLKAIDQYAEEVPLVLLDVFFGEPSPQDSLLQGAIDSLDFPIVGASSYKAYADLIPSPINLPRGIAMYLSVDDNFMKYPLFFDDTLPTLPLVALNASEGVDYSNIGWWSRIEGRRTLANPIIDFKVRPFDLEGENPRYHIHEMGSLLFQFGFWDEADISGLLSGKTIIVGDFETDEHQTVFGTVPGPMIVHNAYLTLAERETLIRWPWLLFLSVLFFWMAWRIYHEERMGTRSWLWQRSQTSLGKIVADSIDDTFFLALGTIVSYFVFNVHINILVLLIFLKLMAWVLRRVVFRKKLAKEKLAEVAAE
jgi:hypothetical protein